MDEAVPTGLSEHVKRAAFTHVARERRERRLSIVHHDERLVVLHEHLNQCVESPSVDLVLADRAAQVAPYRSRSYRESVRLDWSHSMASTFQSCSTAVLDEPGGDQRLPDASLVSDDAVKLLHSSRSSGFGTIPGGRVSGGG